MKQFALITSKLRRKQMKQFALILITLFTLTFVTTIYASEGRVYVRVNGLVCDFCARALEKVFSKQEAVSSIDINLDTKVLVINFKKNKQLDDATITKFVNDAGYSVVNIRHDSNKGGVHGKE